MGGGAQRMLHGGSDGTRRGMLHGGKLHGGRWCRDGILYLRNWVNFASICNLKLSDSGLPKFKKKILKKMLAFLKLLEQITSYK